MGVTAKASVACVGFHPSAQLDLSRIRCVCRLTDIVWRKRGQRPLEKSFSLGASFRDFSRTVQFILRDSTEGPAFSYGTLQSNLIVYDFISFGVFNTLFSQLQEWKCQFIYFQSIPWIAMTCCTYNHGPQRMNYTDFGDPPAGQIFHLYIEISPKAFSKYLWHHHEVDIWDFQSNVLKTIAWICMICGTKCMSPSACKNWLLHFSPHRDECELFNLIILHMF